MSPEPGRTAASPPPANQREHPGAPSVMVIFGGAGDLTKRKLVPALYNLKTAGLLPERFAVLGLSRRELTDEAYRSRLSDDLREFSEAAVAPEAWAWLRERLYYMSGDVRDAAMYERLAARLSEIDRAHQTGGNCFFYLATGPEYFSDIVRQLGGSGLARSSAGSWRRIVVEKPFGRDLGSARRLNRELGAVFDERQVFRIDHYLGKETVQNLLVFRFGNGIFEPIWNRRYIDHVQILAAETVGVEDRGAYYDTAGALRDMVPNHLFQLVTLTAMEPPVSFDADAVRDEQAKILQAVQPLSPEEVLRRTVRGQYGPGEIAGERVPGYRSEAHVDPESRTETFVAMKLSIDNWRWADVPFYLRTGKRLGRRVTEVAIQFKRAPFVLFRDTPVEELTPNRLVIGIQPDERISLTFGAKIPGPAVRVGNVDMDFSYADYFGTIPSTGYERLLHDCMVGDATLFQRSDMVEAGWSAVEPILDVWQALPPRHFPNYAAGSDGPQEAFELLEREGRRCRDLG